mgnify:CR=1 FL=1
MQHDTRPNIVKMDLYGLDNGMIDIESLSSLLTDEEIRIVGQVQSMNRTLSKYLLQHNGGHNLVKIEDVKGYEGCWIDLRAGRVFDANGKERRFYHVGNGGRYLADSRGKYLHRIVAYQYTRVTDYELYKRAMVTPRKFEVHHKDPSMRLIPEGNGITNVVLLEKGLHKRYTEITRKLRDLVECDGVEIPLLKDRFYQSVLSK